jgi:hypothetical protein
VAFVAGARKWVLQCGTGPLAHSKNALGWEFKNVEAVQLSYEIVKSA